MGAFRATCPGTPFEGWVALDIAVRGASLNGKDLDNLAHSVLVPFEEELCVARGTVTAYRIYLAEGGPPGLQVRCIDAGRMLMLDSAIRRMQHQAPLADRLEASLGRRVLETDANR